MAERLIGSEIIRLGNEISRRIRAGERIFNLTIGDFDPKVFPIPPELRDLIIRYYHAGHTNYPPAEGIPELRQSIAQLLRHQLSLPFTEEEIQVAGGARPLIYTIYQTVVDAGDKVVFPIPSWNNNHYCHLCGATAVALPTLPENNFMPTAAQLAPHLKDAVLLALCSPLNPTGTCFNSDQLRDICALVLEENRRRNSSSKPLYLLYDQIYWPLRSEGVEHVHPLAFFPELAPYVIYVDGLSKSLAATGLRVGWAAGPLHVINRMRAILGHIGAWAPRAEQSAAADYLSSPHLWPFIQQMNQAVQLRQRAFYEGLRKLQAQGLPVEVIQPTGGIYLSVRFPVRNGLTPEGASLDTASHIAEYLLAASAVAVVPFTAFGLPASTDWFRISVGTCRLEDVDTILFQLKKGLEGIKLPSH